MVKPTILEIIPLIKLFKSNNDNICGGNLHIYLDDGNIEDGNIIFCLNRCIQLDDHIGKEICEMSLLMSHTQRKKISMMFYEL